MVTLRVGFGGGLADRGAASAYGDAVPDGDRLGPDQDVLDQQPQHALAVFNRGGGGAALQPGQEAFEVVGELEVGVAVGGLGVQGVDLAAQAGFPGAQVRHLGPELVDGDQLLGQRLDHRADRGGGLGQGGLQAVALAGDRVGGPGLLRAGPAVLSREQPFERSWIGGRHLEYLHPASCPRHQRDRAAADSERRRHRGQRSRSRLAVCSWLIDPDHQGPVVLPAHAGMGRPGPDPDSDAHLTSVHPGTP
jgi:hypothetical protein